MYGDEFGLMDVLQDVSRCFGDKMSGCLVISFV